LVAVFYMLQLDYSMLRGIDAILSPTVIIGHFYLPHGRKDR
jgi:hypothetical protein